MPNPRKFERTYPRQPVLGAGMILGRKTHLPSLLDLPHAFTHSGRSAICVALELLGVGPADRVLVPTYHCPTMIAPVEFVGATPAYYPIDGTGRPDMHWMKKEAPHGVKAMLVAHLFGLPIDLNEVATYCRERGIALIEDCAHAFYGTADGVAVGATGDYAIGSLPKFFPVLEGGLLASASRPLEALEIPSQPHRRQISAAWDAVDIAARVGRLGILGSALRTARRFRGNAPGTYDSATSSGSAAISEQVRTQGLSDRLLRPRRACRFEKWIVTHAESATAVQRRRLNFDAFARGLSGQPGVSLPFPTCSPTSAPYVFPLLLDNADAAYARMRSSGLPVFRWDRIWPGTPEIPGDTTTIWSRGIVQIACHQSLSADDIAAVAAEARNCLA